MFAKYDRDGAMSLRKGIVRTLIDPPVGRKHNRNGEFSVPCCEN